MKKILFTCLVSFFVLGCSRDLMQNDENPSSGKTEPTPKGGGRTDIIDVEFETTLPQNLKAKDTRALKERDGESGGPVLIDYSRMTNTTVTVYLCLKNSNSEKTYHTLSGNIKNVNGAYKLFISRQKLIVNGDFSSGSWQACALIDAKNSYTKENGYCPEVNTFNYTSGGDLGNMSVPLYSKYTTITTGSTKTIRLNFQPVGCVIKTTIHNPMAEAINVATVRLRNSNAAAGKVKICFGEEKDGFLKFEKKDYIEGRCDIPFNYEESIGRSDTKTTYMYCIPIGNTQVAESSYEVVYGVSGYTWDKDSIIVSGVQGEDKYRKIRTLENGKSYSMNCSLPESDLMITEMFHINAGGNNCSMIEIYNPTDHAIDLSNYALARIRNWTGASGGSDVGLKAEWQGYSTAHRIFDYALLQSLYIEPAKKGKGEILRGDGNYVNTIDKIHNQFKANALDPSATTYFYNGAENRYEVMYVNRETGRYNKMLDPGKCIILCSGAIHDGMKNKQRNEWPYFPEGSEVFGMPYLPNAVQGNYCQYVIAVDNGVKANDYQWGASGGTFQHGERHIMVLCKRNGPGQRFTPIDYTMEAYNMQKYERIFQSFNFGSSLSMANDHAWYGRRESVLYPTYKKKDTDYFNPSKDKLPFSQDISANTLYNYYGWYIIVGEPKRYDNQMIKKYSPGTRNFIESVWNHNYRKTGAPWPKD